MSILKKKKRKEKNVIIVLPALNAQTHSKKR